MKVLPGVTYQQKILTSFVRRESIQNFRNSFTALQRRLFLENGSHLNLLLDNSIRSFHSSQRVQVSSNKLLEVSKSEHHKDSEMETENPSSSSGATKENVNDTSAIDELNFEFADWEFETTKSQGQKQEHEELRKQKKAETIRSNMETWKLIKAQQLGKADFPDLRKCFQQVDPDSFQHLRNRPLVDVTAVFHHNAWDNIEWNDNMKAEAEQKIQSNSSILLPDDRKQVLEDDASKFWDQFYGIHQNKFFKERNWLFTEFPELKSPYGCSVDSKFAGTELALKRQNETFPGENSKFRVLEIGCGNGSTVFPLLSMNNNPELFVYCCDFSPAAVDVVLTSPKFEPERCKPFVWDVTTEIPDVMPPESLHIIILIFVMSAISPDKFDKVLNNFHTLLKPGGLILFRDYGKYDLVQLRFNEGRCISENFYVRGDGTRVYFFEQDELETIFTRNKFTKETMLIDRRLQVNRLKQLKMYRIWILGKFRKL